MASIIVGNDLGLQNSSLNKVGATNVDGLGTSGNAGEQVLINAATGNLVVQNVDENLIGAGVDTSVLRTYNQFGQIDGDNDDNWRIGFYRKIYNLTGSENTVNSTVTKVNADGSESLYTYDANLGKYVTTEGAGAHQTLTYLNNEWTWSDAQGDITETYEANVSGGGWRLHTLSNRADEITYYEYFEETDRLSKVKEQWVNGQTTELEYSGNQLNKVTVETYARNADGSANAAVTLISATTWYGYDSQGRLETVTVDLSPEEADKTDQGGTYTTTYSYKDASTRIASISQTDGTHVSFTYKESNGNYKVKTMTDAQGDTAIFTYGANKTDVEDALGNVTTFHYDAQNKLIKVEQPEIAGVRSVVEYEYNDEFDADNITKVIDSKGNEVVYQYNKDGNQIYQRDQIGNVIERTYTENNKLETETIYTVADPDGDGSAKPQDPRTSCYIYDSEGYLGYTINAEGGVTKHEWDHANGNKQSITAYTENKYNISTMTVGSTPSHSDLNAWVAGPEVDQSQAVKTEYAYDFRGQIMSTTTYSQLNSAGNGVVGTQSTTHYVYDARGRLLKTVDPRGSSATDESYTSHMTYDGLGRVLTTFNAKDALTQTIYDDANNKVNVESESGLVTTSTYNAGGELVSITQAGADGGVISTTGYHYDATGNLVKEVDNDDNETHFIYDAKNRLVGSIDAEGYLTENVYNKLGQLIYSFVYENKVSQQSLDNISTIGIGEIRPEQSENDRCSYMFYDVAGKLTHTVDAEGYVNETIYDGTGSVIETKRYEGAVSIERPNLDVEIVETEEALWSNDLDVNVNGFGITNTSSYYQAVTHAGGEVSLNSRYYYTGSFNRDSGHILGDTATTYKANIKTDGTGQGKIELGIKGADSATHSLYFDNGMVYAKWWSGSTVAQSVNNASYATNTEYVVEIEAYADRSAVYIYAQGSDKSSSIFTHEVAQDHVTETSFFGATIAEAYGKSGIIQITSYEENAVVLTGGLNELELPNVQGEYNSTKLYYDAVGRLRFSVDAENYVTETVYDAAGQLQQTIQYSEKIEDPSVLQQVAQVVENEEIYYANNFDIDSNGLTLSGTTAHESGSIKLNSKYDYFGAQEQGAINRDETYLFSESGVNFKTNVQTDGTQKGTFELGIKGTDNKFHSIYFDTGKIYAKWNDGASSGQSPTVEQKSYAANTEYVVELEAGADQSTIYVYQKGLDKSLAIFVNNQTIAHTAATKLYGNAQKSLTYGVNSNFYITACSESTVSESIVRSEVDPGLEVGLTESYVYDDAGRLVYTIDNNGQVSEAQYDAAGNITKTTQYSTAIDPLQTYSVEDLQSVLTVYAKDRTTQAKYNELGLLTDQLSGEGNAKIAEGFDEAMAWGFYGTQYEYDSLGRRISSQDVVSKNLFFYDERGLLTHTVKVFYSEEHGKNQGEVTQTVYNSFGDIKESIIYAETVDTDDLTGGSVTATLENRIQSAADIEKDTRTVFEYSSLGQLNKTIDALNYETETIYNAFGQVDRVINQAEVITQFEYDKLGNLEKTTQDLGGINKTTSTVYDAFGRAIYVTDANNNVSSFQYDKLGRVLVTEDALGNDTIMTYDAFGRVLSQMDALGHKTTYTYDDSNKSITITNAEGISTRTISNEFGEQDTITDAKGNETIFEYNHDGQLTKVIDSEGNESGTEYDVAGRVYQTLDANGTVTELQYDTVNRLHYRIVDKGGVEQTTTYGYDHKGQVTTVTGANDTITKTYYTLTGQVDYVVHDEGGLNVITDYEYDAKGNQVSVTEAKGTEQERTTHYVYDGLNRLRFTVDALGIVTENEYDANGQVEVSKRFETPYVGELTEGDLEFFCQSEACQSKIFAYDDLGRLQYSFDELGYLAVFEYDAIGNLIAQVKTTFIKVSEVASENKAYFDSALDVYGYGDNAHIQRFVYDSIGQIRYAIDSLGYATENQYDLVGNVTKTIKHESPVNLEQPIELDTLQYQFYGVFKEDFSQGNGGFEGVDDDLFSWNSADKTIDLVVGSGGDYNTRVAISKQIAGVDPKKGVRLSIDVNTKQLSSSTATVFSVDLVNNGSVQCGLVFQGDKVAYFGHEAVQINEDASYKVDFTLSGSSLKMSLIDKATGEVVISYLNNSMDFSTWEEGLLLGVAGYRSRTMYDFFSNYQLDNLVVEEGIYSLEDANQVRYVYDSLGRTRYAIDQMGYVTENIYDASGNVILVKQYNDAYAGTSYAEQDLELQYSDCPSDKTIFNSNVYDTLGRLAYEIDAEGSAAGYEYDDLGNVVTKKQYASSEWKYVSQEIFSGEIWQYEGGAFGRIESIKSPWLLHSDDRIERLVYDSLGRARFTVDATGYVSENEYNALGQVEATKRFETAYTGSVYTEAALEQAYQVVEQGPEITPVKITTDGVEKTITVEGTLKSDNSELISNVLYVEKISDGTSYGPFGLDVMADGSYIIVLGGLPDDTYKATVSIEDANGKTDSEEVVFTLSDQNATFLGTVTETSKTTETRYVYDPLGRVRFSIDALGYVTENEYDALGNVVATHRYDGNLNFGLFQKDVEVEGNKVINTAAAGDWSAGVVSNECIVGDGFVEFEYGETGKDIIVGLNKDPSDVRTSSYWNQLEYSINITGSGRVLPCLDGNGIDLGGVVYYHEAGNIYRIEVVGDKVDFLIRKANGTEIKLHTLTRTDTTETYYVDMGLYTPGSQVSNLRIGSNIITTRYVYDSLGRVRFTIDALGNVAETQYNGLGQVFATKVYASAYTGATYTEAALKEASESQLAQTQYFFYDGLGRVKFSADHGYQVTAYQYDELSNLILEAKTSLTLVGAGTSHWTLTPVSMQDTENYFSAMFSADVYGDSPQLQRYVYDDRGQIIYTIDPSGTITENRYDAFGTVICTFVSSQILQDTTQATTKEEVEAILSQLSIQEQKYQTNYYDKTGKVVFTFAANGTATWNIFDSFGRLITRITYADPQVCETAGTARLFAPQMDTADIIEYISTQYSSGAFVDEDKNSIERFAYNDNNQLIFQLATSGLLTETKYDADGQVIKTIQYAQSTEITQVDLSHSSIKEHLEEFVNTQGEQDQRTTDYIYDDLGRLTCTISPESIAVVREYDSQGNLQTQEQHSTPELVTFKGKIDVLRAQHADLNQYIVDNEEHLFGMPEQGSRTRYIYDDIGQARFEIDPNGFVVENDFDATGNLTKRVRIPVQMDNDYEYTFDEAKAYIDGYKFENFNDIRVTNYLYNNKNQVKFMLDEFSYIHSYEYDMYGNQISQTKYLVSAKIYQFLIESNEPTIYDTLVTDTSEQGSLYNTDKLTNYFTYDIEGRVIHEVNNSGFVKQNTYDEYGQLIQTINYSKPITVAGSQVNKQYIENLLSNAFGGDVEGVIDDPQAITNSYIYNSKGQVLFVIDNSGQVTENYYDAFGSTIKTVRYADDNEGIEDVVTEYRRLEALLEANRDNQELVNEIYYGSLQAGLLGYFSTKGYSLDAESAITNYYTYDESNRLVFSVDAEGNVLESKYNTFGELHQTLGYDGTITIDQEFIDTDYIRDELTTQGVSDSRTQVSYYDDEGRLEYQRDAQGYIVKFVYNALGQLYQTIATDLVVSETATAAEVESEFDNYIESKMPVIVEGESLDYTAIEEAFENVRITTSIYDKAGRSIFTIDPAGTAVELVYNEFNETEQKIRYATQIGLYEYYLLTRESVITPADIREILNQEDTSNREDAIVYDEVGRVRYEIDAQNYVTENVYDQRDRVISKTRHTSSIPQGFAREQFAIQEYLSDKTTPKDRTYQYIYDENDRVKYEVDPAGKVTHKEYDYKGNLLKETVYSELFKFSTANDYHYVEQDGQLVQAQQAGMYSLPEFTAPYSLIEDTPNAVVAAAMKLGVEGQTDAGLLSTEDWKGQVNINAASGDGIYRVVIFSDIQSGDDPAKLLYVGVGSEFSVHNQETLEQMLDDFIAIGLDERQQRFYYNDMGRPTHMVDVDGYPTENKYDIHGNLIQVTKYAEKPSSYPETSYWPEPVDTDGDGTVDPIINTTPADLKTYYYYDANGRERYNVVVGYDVDLDISTFGQYGEVNESVIIEHYGKVTESVYNSYGEKTQDIRYGEGFTSLEVLEGGIDIPQALIDFVNKIEIVQIQDPWGGDITLEIPIATRKSTYGYDNRGYQNQVIDHQNNILAKLTFDAFGNEVLTEYAVDTSSYRATSKQYDKQNNLIIERIGEGEEQDQQIELQFGYDSFGNQTKVIDPRARALQESDANWAQRQREFMGLNKLAQDLTSYEKQVIEQQYTEINYFDKLDRKIVSKDANENYTVSVYDVHGDNILAVDPKGNAGHFIYDLNGNLSFQINPEGYASAYTYNAYGEMVEEVKYASQLDTKLGYVANLDLLFYSGIELDAENDARTIYEHDKFGRTTSSTDAEGYKYYSYYDQFGNQLESAAQIYTEDKHGETEYNHRGNIYDGFGQLVYEYLPYGSAIEQQSITNGRAVNAYQYNLYGERVGMTEAYGLEEERSTSYLFNSLGQLEFTESPQISVFEEIGQAESKPKPRIGYEYNTRGNLVRETKPDGSVITMYYDAANRQIAKVDEGGYLHTNEYDSVGNLVRTRVYEQPLYDPNTVTQEELPLVDEIQVPPGSYIEEFFYYNANNLKIASESSEGYMFDPTLVGTGEEIAGYFEGKSLSQTYYDANGNVSKVIDAKGGVTYNLYDSVGNLRAVIDQLGYVTYYDFDSQGRMIEQTQFAGRLDESALEQVLNNLDQSEIYYTAAYLAAGSINKAKFDVRTELVEGASQELEYKTDNRKTTFKYDRVGNLIEETTSGIEFYASTEISGRYAVRNEQGDLILDYDPMLPENYNVKYQSTKQYRYDGSGNLIATIYAEGINSSVPESNVEYAKFDALGRKVLTVGRQYLDHEGDYVRQRTLYKYDALGNEIEQIQLSKDADLQIDANRLILNSMGTDSQVTQKVYDYESGGLLRYEKKYFYHDRDVDGIVDTGSQEELDITTIYRYDIMGRVNLIERYNKDASGDVHQYHTTYKYDSFGNKVREDNYELRLNTDGTKEILSDSLVTYRTRYDAHGNIDAKGMGETLWAEYYEYDNQGRIFKQIGEDGIPKIFLYDANGNMTLELRAFNLPEGMDFKEITADQVKELDIDKFQRFISVYDAKNQMTEVYQPPKEFKAIYGHFDEDNQWVQDVEPPTEQVFSDVVDTGQDGKMHVSSSLLSKYQGAEEDSDNQINLNIKETFTDLSQYSDPALHGLTPEQIQGIESAFGGSKGHVIPKRIEFFRYTSVNLKLNDPSALGQGRVRVDFTANGKTTVKYYSAEELNTGSKNIQLTVSESSGHHLSNKCIEVRGQLQNQKTSYSVKITKELGGTLSGDGAEELVLLSKSWNKIVTSTPTMVPYTEAELKTSMDPEVLNYRGALSYGVSPDLLEVPKKQVINYSYYLGSRGLEAKYIAFTGMPMEDGSSEQLYVRLKAAGAEFSDIDQWVQAEKWGNSNFILRNINGIDDFDGEIQYQYKVVTNTGNGQEIVSNGLGVGSIKRNSKNVDGSSNSKDMKKQNEIPQKGVKTKEGFYVVDRKVARDNTISSKNLSPIEYIAALQNHVGTENIPQNYTVKRQQFNAFGQVMREVDAAGNDKYYQYNTKGQVVRILDAMTKSVKTYGTMVDGLDYGYFDDVIVYEEGPVIREAREITSYFYDLDGNLVTTVNSRGNETRYSYIAGLQMGTILASAGEGEMKLYDEFGNLRTKLISDKDKYCYTYDKNNQLVTQERVHYEESAIELWHADDAEKTVVKKDAYLYDQMGNRIAHRSSMDFDENGARIERTAGDLGISQHLNTQKVWNYSLNGYSGGYTDAVSNTVVHHVDQTYYDGMGRVTKQITAGGKQTTYDYIYSEGDILVSPKHPDVPYPGASCLSENGGVIKITNLPGENARKYDYVDYYGRNLKHIDLEGKHTLNTYNDSGWLTKKEKYYVDSLNWQIFIMTGEKYYEDRISTIDTFDYFSNGLLKEQIEYGNNESVLQAKATYDYDTRGNVIKERLERDGDIYDHHTAKYDERNRLVTVYADKYQLYYIYDDVGNRINVHSKYLDDQDYGISADTQDLWYTYDNLDRFTTTMGSFDFDSGRVIRDKGLNIEYDHLGRRSIATRGTGENKEFYYYDDAGYLQYIYIGNPQSESDAQKGELARGIRENDALGRATRVTERNPYDAETGVTYGIVTDSVKTYDQDGNVIKDKDETSNKKGPQYFTYKDHGQVESVVVRTTDDSATTYTTTYEYIKKGDSYKQESILTSADSDNVESWNDGQSVFTYDSRGRLIKMTDNEVENDGDLKQNRIYKYVHNINGNTILRQEGEDESSDPQVHRRFYFHTGIAVGDVGNVDAVSKQDYAQLLREKEVTGNLAKRDLAKNLTAIKLVNVRNTLEAQKAAAAQARAASDEYANLGQMNGTYTHANAVVQSNSVTTVNSAASNAARSSSAPIVYTASNMPNGADITNSILQTSVSPQSGLGMDEYAAATLISQATVRPDDVNDYRYQDIAEAPNPVDSADFDQNFKPVSLMAQGDSEFTAPSNMTLSQIAMQMYGDADMWYLIADANSLTSGHVVKKDEKVIIPSAIANVHNNSETFKPFDESLAMGDVSPTLPDPILPKADDGGGCGIIGTILIVIIAVVVTIFTAGAALAVIGPAITAGAVAAGASLSVGMALAMAAATAVGAMAASMVTQGLMIATGYQEKFSWSAVGKAGLTSFAGSLFGSAAGAMARGGAFGEAVKSSSWAKTAIEAAASSAGSQVASIAMGEQKGFSWKSVAASAVTAGVMEGAFGGDGNKDLMMVGRRDITMGDIAQNFGTNLLSESINAGTRSLLGDDKGVKYRQEVGDNTYWVDDNATFSWKSVGTEAAKGTARYITNTMLEGGVPVYAEVNSNTNFSQLNSTYSDMYPGFVPSAKQSEMDWWQNQINIENSEPYFNAMMADYAAGYADGYDRSAFRGVGSATPGVDAYSNDFVGTNRNGISNIAPAGEINSLAGLPNNSIPGYNSVDVVGGIMPNTYGSVSALDSAAAYNVKADYLDSRLDRMNDPLSFLAFFNKHYSGGMSTRALDEIYALAADNYGSYAVDSVSRNGIVEDVFVGRLEGGFLTDYASNSYRVGDSFYSDSDDYDYQYFGFDPASPPTFDGGVCYDTNPYNLTDRQFADIATHFANTKSIAFMGEYPSNFDSDMIQQADMTRQKLSDLYSEDNGHGGHQLKVWDYKADLRREQEMALRAQAVMAMGGGPTAAVFYLGSLAAGGDERTAMRAAVLGGSVDALVASAGIGQKIQPGVSSASFNGRGVGRVTSGRNPGRISSDVSSSRYTVSRGGSKYELTAGMKYENAPVYRALGDGINSGRVTLKIGSNTKSTVFTNQFPGDKVGPANSINPQRFKDINQKANYVVLENDTLLLGKQSKKAPGGGHIDIANNSPVISAGEVKVVNGKLKYIDNTSGHYQPSGASAQVAAEKAFQNLGFDTTGKYVEKVWVFNPSLPRGGEWIKKD